MPSFWSWITNKIRNVRYALNPRVKLLTFGAIYYGNYRNWKHDPTPLIWCQYSDSKYTHGINIHYLSSADKAWLANTIYIMKKANQRIDGRVFYRLLKMRRPSIVKTAYRMYFTNLLNVKLVSAGITPLDKMVYTNFADPWIAQLNKMIKPSEMKEEKGEPSIRVAYSPNELRDRIIQAQNATDIRKQRVGTGPVGAPAPWLKR